MFDPILISGNPRSGTTFQQWFLSSHPKIQIQGQQYLNFSFWIGILEKLKIDSEFSAKWNNKFPYDFKHFAGSDFDRTNSLLKDFIRDYYEGRQLNDKTRWGLKSPWLISENRLVKDIEKKLWPECKWIVCVRHPFVAFNSQKNHQGKQDDLIMFVEKWIESVNQAKNKKNAFMFQIDKVSNLGFWKRKEKLDEMLDFLGESPSAETDNFVRDWEVVHKQKPDNERLFSLKKRHVEGAFNACPSLKETMKEIGYTTKSKS
jgi:hypothetical protein